MTVKPQTVSGTVHVGRRLSDAVALAVDLHREQLCKGTTVPYVSHLLGVCSLVLEAGGDEDEAVAAVLHDAVEDQGGVETLALIRDRFGAKVAEVVEACSDTTERPKPPALWRKQRYIAHVDQDSTPRSVLLVSAADKLHNLRSILADHRSVGDLIWQRFNLSVDEICWYYQSLAAIYRRRLGGPLSVELDRSVNELATLLAGQDELVWVTVGHLPSAGSAGLGDPRACADRLPVAEPGGCILKADTGTVGMVAAIAETDGLPVEIGIVQGQVVAARIEFVNDIRSLAQAGEGAWEEIGSFYCDQVAGFDLKYTADTSFRIDLPLAPGDLTAAVFRSGDDAVGIRITNQR